jgi:hypothetical protein
VTHAIEDAAKTLPFLAVFGVDHTYEVRVKKVRVPAELSPSSSLEPAEEDALFVAEPTPVGRSP